MNINFDYDLTKEEQLYLDGIKSGIRMTIECFKNRLPDFFDNVQNNIDMMLDPVSEEMS